MQSLFKGIEVSFSQQWNRGIGSIDTRMAVPFGVVYLWPEFHLAAYQGVVSVTVRTVKAACVEHTVEGSTPGNDEVQLMLAMGSGVFPCMRPLTGFGLVEYVGNAEVVVRAQLEQTLSIFIHFHESWPSPTLALTSSNKIRFSEWWMLLMMEWSFFIDRSLTSGGNRVLAHICSASSLSLMW